MIKNFIFNFLVFAFNYENIVTQKEIVWKQCNLFCLCSIPALASVQSLCKGIKSSVKLQGRFWRKHNLRQSRICFRLSQCVPEWNNNEANYFISCCSDSRRKSGVYIFKVPQVDNEWNSKWRKGTEGGNPKQISLSAKHIILNINLQKVCIK